MLRVQNHIHTFKRHTYKSTGNEVFFCTDEKCSFKIDCALALGKLTYCNRCLKEFRMDNVSIRQAKPHCRACDKRRIKDPEGNTRYVQSELVASEIAQDRVESLADRLKKTTVNVAEEDI
jgi:hypothetical protein